MATRALRLGLVLLGLALSLSSAGCTSGPRPQGPLPIPTAPDRGHVYEAVVRMGDRLHSLYRSWPKHISHSTDHPQLPLVEVRKVENRGELEGVDLEALGWELGQQLREQNKLRLLSDESSVVHATGEGGPPQLGSGADEASLVLHPWIDSAGRFCLVLQDAVKDEPLVVARSDSPTPILPDE